VVRVRKRLERCCYSLFICLLFGGVSADTFRELFIDASLFIFFVSLVTFLSKLFFCCHLYLVVPGFSFRNVLGL
jgi:hypothetical protein